MGLFRYDESMQQAPIGVFDSGIGGLSVLADLKAILPYEHFVYLADTAHVPYGERSEQEVRELTRRAVGTLCHMGAKAVVVACNTASAFSLSHLRESFQQPIIGLVPAIKPAAQVSKSKVVGVLATPGTLRGTLLQDVIDEFATPFGVQVVKAAHRELVPMIEAGNANAPATRELLREVIGAFTDAGADTLVLGCTHFPFLSESIQAVATYQLTLIDSGEGVARHTKNILENRDLLRPDLSTPAQTRYLVTGDAVAATQIIAELTQRNTQNSEVIRAEHLDLPSLLDLEAADFKAKLLT